MKLHEAMEVVLKEKNRPLSVAEIADEVNKRNLYTRGDEKPVPASQIHARVGRYPHMFEKNNSLIDLKKQI